MSQPAKVSEPKAQEPSIDEILASIRRSIVPDDEGDRPPGRKPNARKPLPGGTVAAGAKARRTDGEAGRTASLDLAGDPGDGRRDDLPYDAPPPLRRAARLPGDDPGPGDADSVHDDPEEAAPAIAPGDATEACAAHGMETPLLSPRTSAAVDTAFTSLTHTVLSQNPRTLEDLVRDMLKPMLKAWLDANLPDMVERLVRAEIERLSRRG